jgi:predicted outer membrane protein
MTHSSTRTFVTRAAAGAVLALAAAWPVAADLPEIPDTPASVQDVVYARSFQLERGYTHLYRSERPTVESGTLLVIKPTRRC